jgi:hypothetical protein
MMSRMAAPSSEVTTPILRGRAAAALAALVEEAFARQPLFELIEGELPGAESFRLEVLADQLIFALRIVDGDAASSDHAQAVLWLEPQTKQRGAEHHAFDLGVRVLQREVHVAGVPDLAVRELAFHPDLEELFFKQRPDSARQLGDGVNAPFLGGRRSAARRLCAGARVRAPARVRFLEWQVEQAHR